MKQMKRLIGLLSILTLLMLTPYAAAQTQCGIIDRIQMPIDTNTYRSVQDFGAQSGRHQGRYHSGEDWALPQAAAYGQPVFAIADGRVTFASPNGWGRDGGVIILEHAFPDGSTFYSMYGHLTDAEGVQFPAEYTCVRAGEVLASIGDVRPAPHLHFEIRSNDAVWGGAIPGQGYSWQAPERLGLRRASKFIVNWQAWLHDAFRWRVDLADEGGAAAPPLRLEDESRVVLDNNRAIRISPDGRILWRVLLDEEAVGLMPLEDGAARVVFSTGRVQNIALDSTVGAEMQLGETVSSAPMEAFGLLLFRTPQAQLIAFDPLLTRVVWRVEEVPEIVSWAATASTMAMVTRSPAGEYALITIGADGFVRDRAYLREGAGVAVSQTDELRAYTAGGVWTINEAGVWTEQVQENGASYPTGSPPRALTVDGERLYLFAGGTLYAYENGRALWQAETNLASVGGAQLSLIDGLLTLMTDDGYLATYQPETSAPCGELHIWGDWRANAYGGLDADGLYRFYTADQMIGLEWDEFTEDCS